MDYNQRVYLACNKNCIEYGNRAIDKSVYFLTNETYEKEGGSNTHNIHWKLIDCA